MKAETTKQVWKSVMKDPDYSDLYNWVGGVCGEGEVITPETIGMTKHDFMFPENVRMITKGNRIVVYSYSNDGEHCVEFVHCTCTTNCIDDSCDGAHCSVCGSHMLGWYLPSGTVCDSCKEFPEQSRNH